MLGQLLLVLDQSHLLNAAHRGKTRRTSPQRRPEHTLLHRPRYHKMLHVPAKPHATNTQSCACHEIIKRYSYLSLPLALQFSWRALFHNPEVCSETSFDEHILYSYVCVSVYHAPYSQHLYIYTVKVWMLRASSASCKVRLETTKGPLILNLVRLGALKLV